MAMSHDHHMMNATGMTGMTTMAPMHNHNTTTMDMGGGMGGGMDGGHGGHGGHGGEEMDMNHTDRSCSGMMMMFFHKGNCEYILFEAIKTENSKGMIAACFTILVLAIMYEGLKVLREHLLQRSMIQNNKYAVSNGSASQEVVISNTNVGKPSVDKPISKPSVDIKKPPKKEMQFTSCIHMMSCSHFIQTCLHMLQVFISYCLMLVFMTYNVWLCLSVVVGAGLGYFMFGWRKAIVVDINEHCH